MTKVALVGYGKMGKRIHNLAGKTDVDVVGIFEALDLSYSGKIGDINCEKVDCVIDFTHPSVVKDHIEAVLHCGRPIVVGTTGWYDEVWTREMVEKYGASVLYGSNFSLGVQLFGKLTKEAGRLFGNNPHFHATLNEVHHIQKADAPSGTALTLAKLFLNSAGKNQDTIRTQIPQDSAIEEDKFYVTAQRLGKTFGEHSLRIQSEWDDIEIVHKARNRDGFAMGALLAAKWLQHQKPDVYLIEDVVEQVLGV